VSAVSQPVVLACPAYPADEPILPALGTIRHAPVSRSSLTIIPHSEIVFRSSGKTLITEAERRNSFIG